MAIDDTGRSHLQYVTNTGNKESQSKNKTKQKEVVQIITNRTLLVRARSQPFQNSSSFRALGKCRWQMVIEGWLQYSIKE